MRILILPRFVQLSILFLLVGISCNAQTLTAHSNDDSMAITNDILIAMKQSDPDSQIALYTKLLPRSVAIKNDFISNNILLKISENYLYKGDVVKCLTYTKQAFNYVAKLSLEQKANDYYHLGWVYFNMGDYISSSNNFFTALDCIKKSGLSLEEEPGVYRSLGMINFRLQQNEKAIYYFDLGEAIARKNRHKNYIAIILVSKGEYYVNLDAPDTARKYYNEAIIIADEIGRPDIKAEANEGIGKTFIESADYRKAIHYLQLVLVDSQKSDQSIVIDASYYLGDAFYHLGKYKDAEAVLVPALQQAASAKLKNTSIKGYTTLAAVYKATGEYIKALDCMDSINVLKDSLESTEKAKAVDLMDIQYQTAEKDRQIAKSELLIARQNSKIIRKNMWMLSIGASVLLLSLVSVGVYRHTLIKQRYLDRENKIEVLKAAIQGGDNERSRIARELHDGIGGMLSAAMMSFSSMHHNNASITTTPGYRETMDILREMGDEIRKAAHNLMPEVLLKQNLPEAIRSFCNNVTNSGLLQIDFQFFGSFDYLTQDYKLNIYRIVQELIKNIAQHAHASNALVQLLQNENTLIVSVEDNGVGFDIKEIKNGQGIQNIETRVKSLDGNFTIESKQGKGTAAFIEFKISKPVTTAIC